MSVTPAASGAGGTAGAASDEWHDLRALGRFELFLFAAVATVLIVRTALAVAGYPQVGGGGLHVAHVLWGGLLMGAAIVAVLILPGTRVRVLAALAGGIGFGLFIDEIGKFLTKDTNYFFKPAVAIMYAVFVAFYLVVREVIEWRPLTDRRRLALASTSLADLALGQLDHTELAYALALLDGVDETSGLAEAADAVRTALKAQQPRRRTVTTLLSVVRDRIAAPWQRVIDADRQRPLLIAANVTLLIDLAASVVLAVTHPNHATGLGTLLDTGLPTLIALALMVVGVVRLRSGDERSGVAWLQRSVLVQLLFTQVVVFNRAQWLGLIGFALDVLVLWSLAQLAVGHHQQPAG